MEIGNLLYNEDILFAITLNDILFFFFICQLFITSLHISIDGISYIAFSVCVDSRFEELGWHVFGQ